MPFLPHIKPDLSNFFVRVKVQLLASTKVCNVEPLLWHLVDPSQQIPGPVNGLFLKEKTREKKSYVWPF